MRPSRSARGDPRLLAATLALVALLGCHPLTNSDSPFPLSAGFEPLEPAVSTATLPAATATDAHPEGLGPVVAVQSYGHYTSHARGYLHAPLAKVYLALHDPASSYIHNSGGGTRLDSAPARDVEPFPISYRTRYLNSTVIGDVRFEVTYRGGVSDGTEAAPVAIGQRYQKTWGTADIEVMEGSLVATAVEGVPDVTSVEMIAWLQAKTQGQPDCDGTLSDLFGDLQGVLAALP